MTATEVLAAARGNPIGPFVPAREEWLRGWQGPAQFLCGEEGWRDGVVYALAPKANFVHGVVYRSEEPSMESAGYAMDNVRLDLRRPEVRDHLVRLGCPAWARDVPTAVWAWAGGVDVQDVLDPWAQVGADDPDTGATWVRRRRHDPRNHGGGLWVASKLQPWRDFGWEASTARDETTGTWLRGPETGADGRACADLAALRAGCVLEEPDGWYVPLVGGGVGWWAREVHGG